MDAISCSLCLKDGKTVQSAKYCVDCNHQLCDACLNHHNRFDVMKSHQIVEKESSVNGTTRVRMELPSQRCQEHHGKIIDMYCEQHEAACCVACVAVYHNSCPKIAYLPKEAATNPVTDKDVATVKCQILNLQARLDEFEAVKRVETDNLQAEKQKILNSVKELKTMLIQHFDELEKQVIEAVENMVCASAAEIKSDVARLLEMIERLKKETALLEEQLKGKNRSSLFAQLKMTKTQEQRGLELEQEIRSKAKKSLEFLPDLRIYTVLDEIKALGKAFENFFVLDEMTVGEGSVKSKEKSTCDIAGSCALQDGSEIVVDIKHETLKKVIKGYVVQKIELPAPALGVCTMEPKTVITCLQNKPKVVVVCTITLKIQQELYTGKSCRGLAYHNGALYMTGGGSEEENEGPGFLAVYKVTSSTASASGHVSETTYSIKQKAVFEKQLQLPQQIAVSRDGSILYVADAKQGLVRMTKHGRVLSVFTHPEMDTPIGVCLGSKNRLFLAGSKSNNVMVLTEGGELMKTVMTENDGLQSPTSLCFDETRQELMVTMSKCDKVKTASFKH